MRQGVQQAGLPAGLAAQDALGVGRVLPKVACSGGRQCSDALPCSTLVHSNTQVWTETASSKQCGT